MLNHLHHQRRTQLVLGLLVGFCFGFLLQKGGVTRYGVITGQLLLTDFTVVKVILTAIIVGMVGIYFLVAIGAATLDIKGGSWGKTIIGGLIFGVGFGILGYCPGTMMGAAGQGSLDALLGGVPGMLLGSGVFAAIYPAVERRVLRAGDFGKLTLPRMLRLNHWLVIVLVWIVVLLAFYGLESAGF